MNTVADTPLPGLVPDLSAQPSAVMAAAIPDPRESTLYRLKDALVTVYAYGLLGFGLFFPFILVAWSLIFWSPAQ